MAPESSELIRINRLTEQIIGSAVEIHRALGPGLLEMAYEEFLCRELDLRGLPFQRQYPVPAQYKGVRLDCGYRLDLLVAQTVVLEVKAVDCLLSIHDAQLMTYLRLGGWKVGLIINFNERKLINGIRRKVLGLGKWKIPLWSSAPLRPLRLLSLTLTRMVADQQQGDWL